MSKTISKKRIMPLALLISGVLCVIYYIFFKEKFEFNSDFTDTIIWSEAMLTGNGIYDTRMVYAYILPFGGSLIMMPFVAMFGVTYLAHALGFTLFLAIFTAALFFCLKAVGLNIDESLATTGIALILSCISGTTRMIMWGHIIHYSLGLLFVLIGITLFSKVRFTTPPNEKNRISEKSNIISITIFAVFCALCCTNGLTIILFFLVPLLGAIVIERFIDLKKDVFCKENINTLIVLILTCIPCAIGLAVSLFINSRITTVYSGIYTGIQMWQHWIWDISDRLQYFIVTVCGQNPADVSMESFTGIKLLLLALFAYAVLLIPFISLISYKRFENKYMRILVIQHVILVLSSMFIMNFSSAKNSDWRLVGIYMSSVIVTLSYMAWLFKSKEYMRFSVVIAAFMLITAFLTLYNVFKIPNETNRFEKLGNVLAENGLTNGYAQYWSAQVTTVLSDSKATLCPIEVSEDGQLEQSMFNIRRDQYDTKDGVDRYFLFLSEYEYNTLNDEYKDKAADLIQFDDDGYILVFNENLF